MGISEMRSGPKSLKEMMDKEILSQIQQTPLGDMILNHEIKVFTPSEQKSFDNFKSSLRVIFEALMRRNDEEALDEYLQRDLGLDRSTADVINALAGTELIIDEKKDIVSMKSAYSKIVDRYKAEGREEGREEGKEGIAKSLLDLHEEGFISDVILLKSAEKNGVLDIVLKNM